MNKKINLKFASIFSLVAMYTSSTHADLIWPAIFVSQAIFSSLFLVIISILIEALILYKFIPNISFLKSCIISVVGNTFSSLVGTVFMTFAMLFWQCSF